MLKAAIKHGAGEDQVRHRIVPPEAVSKWLAKLDCMKEEVREILQDEKEEKDVRSIVTVHHHSLMSGLAKEGGNGTQEGREHDRA
jgi:hypothetical protein